MMFHMEIEVKRIEDCMSIVRNRSLLEEIWEMMRG
jgi:hypothetical protein